MNRGGTETPRPPLPQETEATERAVVDAAFAVHSALGPGLLENMFEVCRVHELRKRGLRVQQPIVLPLMYDGLKLESSLLINFNVPLIKDGMQRLIL